MCKEFVTVGKLGRTRGLEGELYILPQTDFPERFLDLGEVYLKAANGWEKYEVASTRLMAQRILVHFKDIDTPEAAGRLTNREIAVPKDQVVDLPDDTFFIFDLVGCEVVDEATGTRVGEIIAVEKYPANDAYVIKTVDNREVLFPVVKQFVKKVDVADKKVFVAMTGMLQE